MKSTNTDIRYWCFFRCCPDQAFRHQLRNPMSTQRSANWKDWPIVKAILIS